MISTNSSCLPNRAAQRTSRWLSIGWKLTAGAHSHKHGLDDWARAQDARSRITGWGRTGDAVVELDVGLGALRIEPGVVSLGIFPRSAVQRLLP